MDKTQVGVTEIQLTTTTTFPSELLVAWEDRAVDYVRSGQIYTMLGNSNIIPA